MRIAIIDIYSLLGVCSRELAHGTVNTWSMVELTERPACKMSGYSSEEIFAPNSDSEPEEYPYSLQSTAKSQPTTFYGTKKAPSSSTPKGSVEPPARSLFQRSSASNDRASKRL